MGAFLYTTEFLQTKETTVLLSRLDYFVYQMGQNTDQVVGPEVHLAVYVKQQLQESLKTKLLTHMQQIELILDLCVSDC